jgi:hypothetical protein
MKIYLAGIGEQWKSKKIDTQVMDYIKLNEGKTPEQIATALTLSIDQVFWALDQEDYAFLPETTNEKLQKDMASGKGKPF